MSGESRQVLLHPEILRLLRFGGAGLLNTLFGYNIFLAGLWMSLAPFAALTIATLTGLLFNFLTIRRLVFREFRVVKVPNFLMAYGICYVLNAGLLEGLTYARIPAWLAQLMALPIVILTNYAMMRLWVFRQQDAHG